MSQGQIKRGHDRGGPSGSQKRVRRNVLNPPRPQHQQPQENRAQDNTVCRKCSRLPMLL